MSVLAVEGLQKSFGGVQAVGGVSFSVAAGELLAMIGPNGAGKTTCFNMLMGQLRPDAGSVALDGRVITGPLVGAVVYMGLHEQLVRLTELWRLVLGASIIALVLAFPQGIAGFIVRLWLKGKAEDL